MSQQASKSKNITQLIKDWLQHEPERIRIRRHHIEDERIWREIVTQDIFDALERGKVTRIRESDSTLIWQGKDQSERLLELLCSLVSMEGVDTLFIQEASTLRVGTAYEPGVEDKQLKRQWLSDNPEFRITPDGIVRKKGTKL